VTTIEPAAPGWNGPCQLLALDGGGLRGMFSAAVLAGLEEDLGTPIADHVDLIAGTSTGGLIALGLGAGLTARELVELYISLGPRTFSNPLRWKAVRQLVRPKYRASALRNALQETFGDRLLRDSTKRLVVPAYDLGRDEVYLFKTPHHPRLRRDWRVPMWEVAMATSAAPTYLPAHRLGRDRVRLVDGGVWANNPTIVAIAEATSMLGANIQDIRVLSLGTTSDLTHRSSRLDRGGLLRWGLTGSAVDVILRGQSYGAYTQAIHLLGPDDVLRLDPVVPPRLQRLDRVEVDDILGWAASESRKIAPLVAERFIAHRPMPYAPEQTEHLAKEASLD
jgi:predicted acylesterase/phospholipase RssA